MFGALLGLFGSILPRLITLWESKVRSKQEALDHQREMEMLKLQAEHKLVEPIVPLDQLLKVDMTDLDAAREETISMIDRSRGWVTQALTFWNGQCRPTLALAAFGVYCYLLIVTNGTLVFESELLDDIFFFIVTFYFGGRALHKERRKS